jgi:hypothetical protein
MSRLRIWSDVPDAEASPTCPNVMSSGGRKASPDHRSQLRRSNFTSTLGSAVRCTCSTSPHTSRFGSARPGEHRVVPALSPDPVETMAPRHHQDRQPAHRSEVRGMGEDDGHVRFRDGNTDAASYRASRGDGNASAASYRASRPIGWPGAPYFAAGVPRGLARRIGDGPIRLAWATLPTDGVLQIKCPDRLPDPFIVTAGSSPLNAHPNSAQFLGGQRDVNASSPVRRPRHGPRRQQCLHRRAAARPRP